MEFFTPRSLVLLLTKVKNTLEGVVTLFSFFLDIDNSLSLIIYFFTCHFLLYQQRKNMTFYKILHFTFFLGVFSTATLSTPSFAMREAMGEMNEDHISQTIKQAVDVFREVCKKNGINEKVEYDYTDNSIDLAGKLSALSDDNKNNILTALGQIKYAHYINLNHNGLTNNNIPYLKNLTATTVEWLHLGGNQITDMSFLQGFKQLRGLKLNHCNLHDADIAPLQHLTNLEVLDLHNNHLTDINPLQHLINLVFLNLKNNRITDLSPLQRLTTLENIDCAHNRITDLSTLPHSTQMTVDATENPIPKIPTWLLSNENRIDCTHAHLLHGAAERELYKNAAGNNVVDEQGMLIGSNPLRAATLQDLKNFGILYVGYRMINR